MSNKFFSKLAIVAAGAALGFLAIEANPAQAASVTYDFSVTLPTTFAAPAAGAVGTGFLTFDDAQIAPAQAFQALDLAAPGAAFSFNLLGQTFSTADGRGQTSAIIRSGTFRGTSFDLNEAPAGFDLFAFALSESSFSGFDNEFTPGNATIGYTRRPNVVPTPALLPGLIGLGVAALRKRDEQAA